MTDKEKQIWLFGVFTACPLKNALEGCPFEHYRKLSALKRWECIKKLSGRELDEFINLHKECVFRREMGKIKVCVSTKKNASAIMS